MAAAQYNASAQQLRAALTLTSFNSTDELVQALMGNATGKVARARNFYFLQVLRKNMPLFG